MGDGSWRLAGRRGYDRDSIKEPLASWFSVRAYPSGNGLAIYFANVTEEHQARESARVSEERFRLLARATSS